MATTPAFDDLFVSFQTALAGRYSLERELGRGGMGVVYLAREVRLDRPVALKLFPPALAALPHLRERFLREARTAARLSHPHIVQIYTVDEVDQFVFFAMAYVDGETLGSRVRNRGPMPPSEAARMLREVAWALGHAHEQGVIHRDVKPDNILIEASNGRALVADFGIAGLSHDAGMISGEVIGTPEFMSPEQAGGDRVDAQSDIYALGVVAFYALSGRVPFSGKKATDILAQHMTKPAPPVMDHAPATPRRIARIVDACLAKEPVERPASAGQLAEQLALTLEHRKELPVALRSFVKHDARIDGPGIVLAGPVVTAVAVGLGYLFQSPAVGFVSFYGGVALAYAAVLTGRARRLLKTGFDHADLAVAFKTETERGKEERAFSVGSRPSFLERLAKAGAYVGWGGFTLGIAVQVWLGVNLSDVADMAWAAAGSLGFVSSIVHLSQLQRRKDVDTAFWGKLWTGRLGRTFFKIARALLPAGSVRSAMTHRPTELAIGMAIDQLFADLPKATRKQMADLPDVVQRLEADAQRMRAHLEELSDLAAEDASIGAERDAGQKRLGEAVAALETLRLGLLRLKAGVGTVSSLTTGLVAAREVGEAVDRLLAGQLEVEETLKRATPV